MAEIKSINELLRMEINIPDYQRPYKWTIQNIEKLLSDINSAINDAYILRTKFKYRIGTIILHKDESGIYNVVDGQQRIISLLLINQCIKSNIHLPILKRRFTNKVTQTNIHNNYKFIKEWFSLKNNTQKKDFVHAFDDILEVVIIRVNKVSEAFQLFDSQNTRGKKLDPHDLLKAYHLREMKNNLYEMERAVTKWEAKNTSQIRELFDIFLFPICNWSRGMKSKAFTAKEIDIYKGVSESSTYSYARRAIKAMPCFQITEAFISGNDFFEMVDYYLYLLRVIKTEILNNPAFRDIKKIICNKKEVSNVEEMDSVKYGSVGFVYSRNLFYCALLTYYDRFRNFDEMAVKKLFTWAFMLRVDLKNLGYDSINKYAIGDSSNSKYTNRIEMFSKISFARLHNEISSLQIKVIRNQGEVSEKWEYLYKELKKMNGLENSNE